MEKANYVTKEGWVKLQEELDRLEGAERRKISKQISDARDKGDLSENAEYDAAKEAQSMLEIRISSLKKKLSISRVLDSSQLDHSKVSILSTVILKNLTLGTQQVYTLVPEGEADLKEGKISVNTPIALGLLGKKKGQLVHIELPNKAVLNFEIVEIKSN